MVSWVWRIPAVSIKRNEMPLMVKVSSITSRVVPAISETMALSSLSMAFSRVDLPTLGFPTMATGMPFFIAFPRLKVFASLSIWLMMVVIRVRRFERSANSTSSSLKSSSSSIRLVKVSSCSRRCSISFEKPPRIWFIASRWLALLVDEMRSATASACDRSNLPLRKARWVNSPGWASVAPALSVASTTRCWMYTEPWHEISTESSPVNE